MLYFKIISKLLKKFRIENEIEIDKKLKIDDITVYFNNLMNFKFGSILDFTLTTDNKESDLAEYNIELVSNNKIFIVKKLINIINFIKINK